MTIQHLVLEAPDPAASDLLAQALGVDHLVSHVPATGERDGFHGFSLSLVCSQPGNVDALYEAATAAGATPLKTPAKSFWGYGAVVQAPDGTVWKLASSAKKDTAPAAAAFDDLVLLLGVTDVKASKRFYVEQGLSAGRSFGGTTT